MDGNFRWACRRGGDWRQGHVEGSKALLRLTRFCRADGIKALTVYAFSSENWGRSPEEVGFLMRLMEGDLLRLLAELQQQGVRILFAGDRGCLPGSLQQAVRRAEQATAGNTDLLLCVCVSYGGRQDITRAAQQLCREVQEGSLAPEQVTEQLLAQHLSTHEVMRAAGDPDLLIRTSGEQRLSNFLLWECAYTELYFTPTYWPDFDEREWREALRYYSSRQRRYGRRRGAEHRGRVPAPAG